MALDACLDRIKARDAKVRGWEFLDTEACGGSGPLAGVVVGVKDVIDVAGMPTTFGSQIFAGNIAMADAQCVALLRAAGAIVLGKTVTAEFATYHPGATVNPWKEGHTPGGSSSGSAAVVADGQADIALGTQTAGSVIRPASFCGILGLKPTIGRYPTAGMLDTSKSLDTLGLFARSLDLLTVADGILADDVSCPPPCEGLRVGICRGPAWPLADADMLQIFEEFAARLSSAGIATSEITLPPQFAALQEAQALIHMREAWLELGHIRYDHPDEVSPAFTAMIDAGEAVGEDDYRAALAMQAECRALLPEVFHDCNLLLLPGATGAAPAGLGSTGDPAFQRIWTAVGAPCLGFPAGWTDDGLPLGLQIVGQPGADRQLLADAPIILAHAQFKDLP